MPSGKYEKKPIGAYSFYGHLKKNREVTISENNGINMPLEKIIWELYEENGMKTKK